MNLTAIRDPEEIVTRHFGESFFLARHLFPANSVESVSPEAVGADLANQQRPLINPNSLRVADIGSGAGFPGLPIKLWNPHLSLTLIESNHKKATFLREVTRALTLTNVDIRNVRAETLPPSSFDVVTLRAVERLTTLLAPGASLLAPGGRLALLISEAQVSSVVSAETNVRWDDPISLPTSKTGILLIGLREPK